MGAKENILRDIHTLISTKYNSPEDAFVAFDKDKDGSLNKDEIKDLLKAAGVNSFLRRFAIRSLRVSVSSRSLIKMR